MLSVTTTISGTDYGGRGSKAALTAAADKALWFHRKKYMKHHFETYARSKYGAAYNKTPGSYARGNASTRKRGNVRKAVNRERRMERAQDSGTESYKERKKRPLYDSGLARRKILGGGVDLLGRYDKRTMRYNPPFYILINPAGQLNKVKALTVVIPSEERKMAIILEKLFFRNLERKQTTKKG